MKALEEEHEGRAEEDYDEEFVGANGCSCFQGLCFRWRRDEEVVARTALLQHKDSESSTSREIVNWFVQKGKKLKEISELVAGPKWKTFIRKFSYGNKMKRRNGEFQYDAHSYALNFDHDEDEDNAHLGFSARFAAPMRTELARDAVQTQLNRS